MALVAKFFRPGSKFYDFNSLTKALLPFPNRITMIQSPKMPGTMTSGFRHFFE